MEYYSIRQVSIILKVHHLTVRRYIRQERLKAVRVGGAVRIAKKDLEEFVKNFEPHARAPKPQKPPFYHQTFDLYDPVFRLKARGASSGY